MKKLILLLTITTLSTSALAEETSWLDKLKGFVGLGEAKTEVAAPATSALPNTTDMVAMLTSSLNVDSGQASGGLGAIFNYVKKNVSTEQFMQLSQSLPGVDSLISLKPDVSAATSSQGLGGLLDKASEYNDSLKAANEVKKQFEALGLKPEMISDFVGTAQSYLNTEQGQQAKQILAQGVGKLMG